MSIIHRRFRRNDKYKIRVCYMEEIPIGLVEDYYEETFKTDT